MSNSDRPLVVKGVNSMIFKFKTKEKNSQKLLILDISHN